MKETEHDGAKISFWPGLPPSDSTSISCKHESHIASVVTFRYYQNHAWPQDGSSTRGL